MKKNERSPNGGSGARFGDYAWGVNYARLSDTRNENEISVERQCDNAHDFFKRNKIPHDCATDHFIEPKGHRSGWSEKQRPAYRQMRESILRRTSSPRKGKGLIWCQDQSRFTRAEDATAVIRHWLDMGVDLVFGDELVSLATFDEWMKVHTRSYIHSIESQLGKERMQRYYKKLYDSGAEHRRHALFGLEIVGSGKDRRSVANPETLPTVIAFLEIYARGNVGTGTLGVRLARGKRLQFLTKQKTWRPAVTDDLMSILENLEAYEPFIEPELYARAMQVRAARRRHKQNHAAMKHPPVMLRGVAVCANCGTALRQHSNVITRYASYRHPSRKAECEFEGRYIAARGIDAQATAKLRELESIHPKNKATIIARLMMPPRDEQGERNRAERAALEQQRARLMDGWLIAGLSPEEFRKKREALDAALAELPDVPAPQAAMERERAESLFASLAQNLERAARAAEVGNELARAFFARCEIDYAMGGVECRWVWE